MTPFSWAGRRVLLVSSQTLLAVAATRALAFRGARVEVAGRGPGWLFRASRRCAAYHRVSQDEAGMAAAAPAVARAALESRAEVLVPADVSAALLVPALKSLLPSILFFPTPPPELLRVMDDKWAFQTFLVKNGLPAPEAWLVSGPDEARALSLPLIFKPKTGSGGVGVRTARDAAERERALARYAPGDYPLVAQRYLNGEDVDVSFLADRGRLVAWAVQTHRAGTIDYEDDADILSLAAALAKASAYTGVAHVDMRREGPGRARALPIECNPRLWGTYAHLLGWGLDFIGLGLQVAEGKSPAAITAGPRGSCTGLGAAARLLLSGKTVPREARAYLRERLFDPGPELLTVFFRAAGAPGYAR